mmetsp:Transcript_12906/g.26152  ORF Transcript_12906/g.26152 Transcript_12906/m.26152 type:complete len:226 (+) Transcript_12906:219-896(+)
MRTESRGVVAREREQAPLGRSVRHAAGQPPRRLHGGHIDDSAAPPLATHDLAHCLREEERCAQIDRKKLVEKLDGRAVEVRTPRVSGCVDKTVDASKAAVSLGHRIGHVCRHAHVAAHEQALAAALLYLPQRLAASLRIPVAQHNGCGACRVRAARACEAESLRSTSDQHYLSGQVPRCDWPCGERTGRVRPRQPAGRVRSGQDVRQPPSHEHRDNAADSDGAKD